MLTKKFTDFSADLLDTVRGVLGEAKKCEDCGCAKCECEEDDMEEGYVPTSDEPTEANKKTADKVRALLAKEKKPVKEEIDDALEAELKAQRQTKKSVADAKKKYGVKEEAEQIDEISGKTLSSYSAKVANYGPMKDAKTREKHEKGLYTAYKKMKAKDVKVPARMEEVEQIDELSDSLLKNYSKKALAQSKTATGDQKLKRQVGARNAIDRLGNNTLAKEEVEQIDELSKATMGRYINKAATKIGTQGVTAGLKIASDENSKKNFKDMGKREKGIARAVNKLTKEEQEFIDALNADTLDEARGRPRKAGAKDFTIHPKTKEKLMHNNPEHMKKIEALQRTGALQKPKTEAGQHIINQLRKASTSMTGGTTVHFTHGDSKHVSAAHASKALDKYAGMKPNEKEDFQKKIGHSHENLMKHI